ncbi:LAMI_0D11254g1_1 [Lachancea mirantina]|uniref:LAMI_0D11254g1_1 n=1 Tax=Lachancea mirantina TaxID=1230905 RepID=A0A1G4JF71_9SACH|nr:LAMI_0D11254g1_1 [Lachancea mirantina]
MAMGPHENGTKRRRYDVVTTLRRKNRPSEPYLSPRDQLSAFLRLPARVRVAVSSSWPTQARYPALSDDRHNYCKRAAISDLQWRVFRASTHFPRLIGRLPIPWDLCTRRGATKGRVCLVSRRTPGYRIRGTRLLRTKRLISQKGFPSLTIRRCG